MRLGMTEDRNNPPAESLSEASAIDPSVASTDGLDTRMVIRCTAADKALAFANAREGGYSDLSAFVRHVLCDQKPKRRSRARTTPLPTVQALAALVRELQGQGNNLNQIAKHLNAGRDPVTGRIEEALHLHEQVLMSILEAFGNT